MNKLIIIAALIIAAFGSLWFLGREDTSGKYDAFAQCLQSKEVTMYGAEWCPHCQNEKKAFGSSFKYVPYVECPEHTQECLAKGIEGYPTWIFSDGKKLIGEQGLQKLSQESGCSLPQ